MAVGTIGGALIGSHAQSQANQQAAATQNQATAAQLALGEQSLAQNQAIYNSNYNTLAPWVSRGNVAGDAYNALLGLPAAPQMTSPLAAAAPANAGTSAGMPATPAYNGPSLSQIYAMKNDGIPGNFEPAMQAYLAAQNRPAIPAPTATPAPAQVPTAAPTRGPAARSASSATNALSPQSAFNNFAHSAGMDFQLQQGTNALNNLYAARGVLQSGAAMKGISNYAQQTALQNYFLPYMNMVGGVSSQGLNAGSAIAGVGQNAANTAASINSNMGSSINAGAQNIGNLQLANGQNQANMWGRIGGALGSFGSSFFPTPTGGGY
jgi:hypothetical protein